MVKVLLQSVVWYGKEINCRFGNDAENYLSNKRDFSTQRVLGFRHYQSTAWF